MSRLLQHAERRVEEEKTMKDMEKAARERVESNLSDLELKFTGVRHESYKFQNKVDELEGTLMTVRGKLAQLQPGQAKHFHSLCFQCVCLCFHLVLSF